MTIELPVQRFSFSSDDGLSIACVRWDAWPWEQKGIVQVAHGMGEHIGRYQHLAELLCHRGWTVYGGDHRGHGRTVTDAAQRGDFGAGGFDALVADMATLNGIIRIEHPNLPCVLFGHSMGSFAAQQFILHYGDRIDALALSGSGSLEGLSTAIHVYGAEVAGRRLNAHFAPVRTPFDWLSSDPQAVDDFLADPLCFAGLTETSAASIMAAAPALADPKSLAQVRSTLPIRFFSGSEDPIGQYLAGVLAAAERYRQARIQSVSLDIEMGARHELINERRRDEICQRIVDWIDAQAGAG
ncbi:MAG: alpha/beta hydrolase [Pseudoxanthomonas sp.]